jgi:hypothetical protein
MIIFSILVVFIFAIVTCPEVMDAFEYFARAILFVIVVPFAIAYMFLKALWS